MPATLAPQTATLVDTPPSDPQAWSYEIKFDGYRLLIRVDGADIKPFTRNGNDWTSKLLPLRKASLKAKLPAGWYDGEMVVLNDKDLQSRFVMAAHCGEACSGNRPRSNCASATRYDAPAESVLASACRLVLEGVIAKRLISTYVSLRSSAWARPMPLKWCRACT